MKCPRRYVSTFAFLLAAAGFFASQSIFAQHGGGHAGGGVGHAGAAHSPGGPISPTQRSPMRSFPRPVLPIAPRGAFPTPRPIGTTFLPMRPILPWRYRPRRPVPPFFGVPFFGFGSPFFGLGFYGFLGPNCYSFWNWGYDCSPYPYYSPDVLEYSPGPVAQEPLQLYVSPRSGKFLRRQIRSMWNFF